MLALWPTQYLCHFCCRLQAQELADAGHVPDKVVLLEGPHALLLNRVKYRRVDYTTGRCCHTAVTSTTMCLGITLVSTSCC